MNIVIPVKLVPDLVEELTIADNGAALDTTWMRWIINEFDDHAIEQGILLKERYGGQVIVIALDMEGIDDVFYTAAAKGADRMIRLTGSIEENINNHAQARIYASFIQDLEPALILTGVQAHNDLDGQMGPLLAEYLGLPYVGYVSGVTLSDGKALVKKEYPGGLIAEIAVSQPALLGIQAADEPPRYIAFSKVRQAMKTATIEEINITMLDSSGGPNVDRMYPPAVAERATMLEGDLGEIANQLIAVLDEFGVL